ncbi:uncharacterized protein PITG_09931 [Phytophthora infestans T30-4]|uniref:Uncharacterized protein n=1 Tax=Phytophthora infestans (strain T30-4) TaxID=403677 RepID=D0NDV9_PHYIT|nr:uncharacterized protein PITG_09931 [Phytophthora infestans T30-4]EEY56404.1 conserved hypothetical protein [Phytophthora infestans T30-4]|eukprot:XP_002902478.1 conserved hypothetical protein [Phytophthora infestans T30-4]
MLLPTPLDERQSPLRSPVRRKRLRKRVRRRLRRRSRRSWQASHASWPPHASADYIVDHARQDIAGINAARLVQRLGVNTQALSRASSMPLPPLKLTLQERVADTTSTRRRPLYHQPAWISPELHTWLVTSGLFATKPRHELLSTDL